MAPRLPTPHLHLIAGGDVAERLRQAFLAMVTVFCIAEPASALATPHTGTTRLVVVLGCAALLLGYGQGFIRGAFPPPLRIALAAITLVLAPALGPSIFGAALIGTLLLSLYPGAPPWATAAGFSVSALVGTFANGMPMDPGAAVGVTITLFLLAEALDQLRQSLLERDELQRSLLHQAHHDSLTGLANRQLFTELLNAAVDRHQRHGEPYAVLMLDLDDFKRVNDTYGHGQGDRLLQAVARRADACLRSSDHIARLGGDEFAVLVENCRNPAVADDVARRLAAELAAPVELDGDRVHVHVSIGSAWNAPSAEAAVCNADHAMYRAKAAAKLSAAQAAGVEMSAAPHP